LAIARLAPRAISTSLAEPEEGRMNRPGEDRMAPMEGGAAPALGGRRPWLALAAAASA
jgi:hypothetical protein